MNNERKTPAVNQQIKDFADELLDKYHPGHNLPNIPIQTGVDAAIFREHLRQQVIGDLLVQDGESLFESDLDMFVNTGPTQVIDNVALRVWGKGWDFEDTDDWQRQIDIRFFHENEENGNTAIETLALETFRHISPLLFRYVSSQAYAVGQGYERHNFSERHVGKKQTKAFLDAVRHLEGFALPRARRPR